MNIVGDWAFDSKVVPIFNEHVRQHVPFYDEIHRMIAEMSHWFVTNGTNVYDIGTSTGYLINNLLEEHKGKKDIVYRGIDESFEMMMKAGLNFKGYDNVLVYAGDIANENATILNASLVVSMLTIQFIDILNRQKVVDKIYNGLNKGGAFIFVEKVIGNNANFNDIFVEMYHEMKLRNGITEKQVMDKARSIRGVLKPLTIDENIDLMKNAGFKNIDTFFKWGNFAGFIAIK